MTPTDQPAADAPDLQWRGGLVPVSTRFADPYFSLQGGLAESRHVFLAGNGLPQRLTPGFHIAELGFGTGLNMLAVLIARAGEPFPPPIRYTAFEAFPLPAHDIARALSLFPEAAEAAQAFLSHWAAGRTRFDLDGMAVEVHLGDARATLPAWDGIADAWFLDGFAPARNPELWSDDLMGSVARHTAPGGTFATYSAAGAVRASLARHFEVTRLPGFATKRHMTAGVLKDAPA